MRRSATAQSTALPAAWIQAVRMRRIRRSPKKSIIPAKAAKAAPTQDEEDTPAEKPAAPRKSKSAKSGKAHGAFGRQPAASQVRG